MNSRIVAELLESFPKLLLPGLKVTLPLTALSFTIGIAIALATALVQIAHIPVLRRLARVYIWIIRCTPMIVQLFVVYFGLPNIGICLDSFSAAVLVFSISVGAYCSETIRAAIESVFAGQMERGLLRRLDSRSGYVPRNHASAMSTAFPPLSNALIGLVKDTSLAYSVALVEILASAQRIAARTTITCGCILRRPGYTLIFARY